MKNEWTSPDGRMRLINGDCIESMKSLPDCSVNCCVTSPPYFGLRDYGMDGQIGLEKTPDAFVAKMVEVFREVKRVLRDDGTLWLNFGDSYASGTKGSGGAGKSTLGPKRDLQNIDFQKMQPVKLDCGLPDKQLIGIPWRVAFALQADGWYLRQDIIWHKPNPMPESVKDRCTKAHEYIFLLSKSPKYYFDAEAIKEPAKNDSGFAKQRAKGQPQKHHKPGHVYLDKREECQYGLNSATNTETRNRRSVWTVTTKPYKGAHFATFPPDLIEPCILAGCPVGGIVLDPFNGAGTTAIVSAKHNRNYIGTELNPEYVDISIERIKQATAQKELF